MGIYLNEFGIELKLIKNDLLKSYVEYILKNKVDPLNFTAPASSTGKFHPKFALGREGLVRHTRSLVKVLTALHQSRPSLHWNELYAAAILHDMCKYTTGNKYSNLDHAELMKDVLINNLDQYIEDNCKKLSDKKITNFKNSVSIVSELISHHMGRFDNENIESDIKDSEYKDDIWILHYSDLIVSRVWYSTNNLYMNDGLVKYQIDNLDY